MARQQISSTQWQQKQKTLGCTTVELINPCLSWRIPLALYEYPRTWRKIPVVIKTTSHIHTQGTTIDPLERTTNKKAHPRSFVEQYFYILTNYSRYCIVFFSLYGIPSNSFQRSHCGRHLGESSAFAQRTTLGLIGHYAFNLGAVHAPTHSTLFCSNFRLKNASYIIVAVDTKSEKARHWWRIFWGGCSQRRPERVAALKQRALHVLSKTSTVVEPSVRARPYHAPTDLERAPLAK